MSQQHLLEREEPAPSASALVVLTPAESKRLIAKAVAALPEVKKALQTGTVIIARGTTNAYVAEEILSISITPKSSYTLGCITGGELTANISPTRHKPLVLRQGKPVEMTPAEALREFTSEDVFIKGANAVDIWGNAGILARTHSKADAGTIGAAWAIVVSRGAHLIVPVGLEKLIPSVRQAARRRAGFKYSVGLPSFLVPLVSARVITEIQAFQILAEVTAVHISSGGIGGSEGAVVLTLEGSGEKVDKAFHIVRAIKGEPPIPPPEALPPSAASCDYHAAEFTESITRLLAPR
jgi:hypothetical protein